MRMRHFTHRQPSVDIRITTQEWKPDPEVSLKHDDLYARAWECEYGKPIFDAENNIGTPPKSPEFPVESDLSTEDFWNTPGNADECFREIFAQTKELSDVTDTDPDMEPDVETSSEAPNKSPTNLRSSKYNLPHKPKPICNDDY